jgi:hypothetical protein
MIGDTRNTFADRVALNTGAAGDYVLGNVVDLGSTGIDLGAGKSDGDVYFYALVTTTATSGGSATLQISLATSDASDLSSPTKILTVPAVAVPVASLVAGFEIAKFKLPDATYKRYIGAIQTTGTAAFTAGAVFIGLVQDARVGSIYPQTPGI